MVTDTQRRKHAPTLAWEVIEKFSKSIAFTLLSKLHSAPIDRLFSQLQQLNDTKDGNRPAMILSSLQEFHRNCEKILPTFPHEEQEMITSFRDNLVQELEDLYTNIIAYEVSITSALDGYTLNRTTSFIKFLEFFINEHETLLLAFRRPEFAIATFYEQGRKEYSKYTQQAVNLAQDLKNSCEHIRAQIGSPETMPRGLIINFMMHLWDGLNHCQTLLPDGQPLPATKLLAHIESEIEQLHHLYPDLAEAGQGLQEAIYCQKIQNR